MLKVHGGLKVSDLLVAGWADAAAQNRTDGKSTLGIMIGITSGKLKWGDVQRKPSVLEISQDNKAMSVTGGRRSSGGHSV